MLNKLVEDMAIELVDKKIANGTSFTAYDITVETRKLVGRWENVGHAEIRSLVHNYMLADVLAGGDYASEAREVVVADPVIGSSGVAAIVYFNPNYPGYISPYTGNPTVTNYAINTASVAPATKAPATLASVVPVAKPTPVTVANVKGTKSLDDKFRLRVPVDIVLQAGFSPYDEVGVSVDQGAQKIVISNTVRNNVHTVDTYGNLRIALKQFGVGQKRNYKFTTNRNSNSITAVIA